MKFFLQMLACESRLLQRSKMQWLNPLIFFALISALFPLAIGPQPELLRAMAPGVLWVSALLAVLLSVDGLFRSDLDDGLLEQWVLSAHPLYWLALSKVLAHWLWSGLTLVLLSPLLALMLGVPAAVVPVLMLSLLLGTLVLSLLGAIGAALTVGLSRGGVLLALLIVPFYVPVLILGVGTLESAASGLPVAGYLLWLASLVMLNITLAPFAIAAALMMSMGKS